MPFDMKDLINPLPVDMSDAYTSGDVIVERYKDAVTGKTILITGVSPDGVGAATALSLAIGSPKLLILAGRDLSKVNQTAEEVKAVNPSVEVQSLELDLNSLKQVTMAAKSLSGIPHIDILINNAGIMAPPYTKSAEGYESQFVVNYLAHFQLTRLLLPQLQASPDGGRVVNVTSDSHRLSGIIWDDPVDFEDGKKYDEWIAYGQSKTAVILSALHLVKSGKVMRAYSVHPGVVQTQLLKPHAAPDIMMHLTSEEFADFKLKTPKEGASGTIRAALDDSLDNFAYLEHCQVTEPASHALGVEDAERLWKLSEELVDTKVTA